jgi:hypothetical protein
VAAAQQLAAHLQQQQQQQVGMQCAGQQPRSVGLVASAAVRGAQELQEMAAQVQQPRQQQSQQQQQQQQQTEGLQDMGALLEVLPVHGQAAVAHGFQSHSHVEVQQGQDVAGACEQAEGQEMQQQQLLGSYGSTPTACNEHADSACCNGSTHSHNDSYSSAAASGAAAGKPGSCSSTAAAVAGVGADEESNALLAVDAVASAAVVAAVTSDADGAESAGAVDAAADALLCGDGHYDPTAGAYKIVARRRWGSITE